MLAVEQVHEYRETRSDSVICPACNKGRLCDKPVGEKVKVVVIKADSAIISSNQIILKCPKCGKKSAVYISE